MFKVIRKTVALLVLTLLATLAATAQTVNMSRYITLTVQQGQQIELDLRAAASGTGVKIVSGSTNETITVGTSWTDFQNYTAGATTMTVYGNIIGFNCDDNVTKLTAIDISHNTALKTLLCQNNQLTALDVSQNTALTVLNCAHNQLTSLNVTQNTALTWLRCHDNRFTTQAFNDLMCSLPTRTTADSAKFFPLWSASDANHATFMATNAQIAKNKNWQVRYSELGGTLIPATTGTYTCPVVNMSRHITLTVQQGQQIRLNLMAAAAGTPVKIVSGSTEQTIIVGENWTGFQNYTAGAGTMTVYGDITRFNCSGNGTKLTALDVSQNTALKWLWCTNNQLTSLDVSHNTALTWLVCYGNNFTTQAFNDLMCSLPARTTADDARFYPLWNASDANHATFMATNAQIAKNKNWQVRYQEGSEAAIPATTGTYTCPVVNMSRYITLAVQQGQRIELNLMAAAAGTGVKIVSGSTNQTITVGTNWTGYRNYTAGSTTMTVYGDITGFGCDGNEAKLTALDVSHNTALTRLYCYGNSFTTQAFNDLMCSLPARTTADDAKFYPLDNASDAGASAFMAANAQIATAKNWQVRYVAGGDIPATTGTYTCPVVNMSRYITLTVTQGQQITLNLWSAAAGTKVKVVSGSTNQNITVGTSGTGYRNYTAGATTMTVYGDITGFYCSDNGTKLTALNVSHNTALKELYCSDNQLTSLDVSQNTALTRLLCHGNRFTTQAFNDLMCSLPARTTADDARFYPLLNASDAGYAAFMAANAQIATGKNWKVRYAADGADVPPTTGTYVCPVVNMSRYIELTVTPGSSIWLSLIADANDTPVKIVSGTTAIRLRASSEYWIESTYIAQADTMRVYGDVAGFDCGDNAPDITGLDVSHNTALTGLSCYGNQLTTLDVRQNTALTWLMCDGNQLTTLDVSQNTALIELYCVGNNFTTQAIDDIYCSLPQRQPTDNAKIYPVDNPTDINHALVLATNKENAINKGWKVLYWDDTDIPATTGTYVCGGGTGIAEVASVPLAVYPNPATDILTVETEAAGSVITLTDLTGRTVLTATATAGKTVLNLSELSAGTYIVRVGDRVGKVVKR